MTTGIRAAAFLARLAIAIAGMAVLFWAGSRIVDALADAPETEFRGLMAVIVAGIVSAAGYLWWGWPRRPAASRGRAAPRRRS